MTDASPPGALEGIRVLEFSQIVAGPVVGILLSDMGADVVKVEPPHGEARRNSAAVVPNEGKYFQSLNRGKRSLTINLAHPKARDLVHRLIPSFDVVITNYRAGVAERLGVDYTALSAINPRLIYASITGFGEDGPFATRAGSDIVAQAYTGLMAAEAKLDDHGAPVPITSAPVIDRSSGLAAAMGICAALYHRERTGEGQALRVSLLHTGLDILASHVMREPVHDVAIRDPFVAEVNEARASGAAYGEIARIRKSQWPRFASHRLYYGGYHTSDGAIVLGAVTLQNRNTLRAILDMHDDTDSAEFDAAAPDALDRIAAWRQQIQDRLIEQPAAAWVERFLEAGVPASIVNMPEEMAEDPQVEATGIMEPLEHAITGPQRVVGPIVKMSATPTRPRCAAPPLGAHTREVLLEAGLDQGEIADLLSVGVVTAAD